MVAAIARMSNCLEPEGLSLAIPAAAAPNEQQRFFIANRVNEIDASLSRAPSNDLLAEVTTLMRTMKARNGDEDELSALIRVYIADLEDLPLWAVSAACRAYRRGDVGAGVFLPTPGELRKTAKTYTAPWVEERAKLSRIITARVLAPVSPESEQRRDAALAHVRETGAMLRATAAKEVGSGDGDAHRVPSVPEAQQWLDRYQQGTRPLPKLSPALRRSLGVAGEDEAAA